VGILGFYFFKSKSVSQFDFIEVAIIS